MLEITQQARAELHDLLESVLSQSAFGSDEAKVGFRLVATDGADERAGLGLTVDAVRAGDEVFEHRGRHVLLMDGVAAGLVDGLVLDVVDTAEGRRLGLRDANRDA